MNLYFKYFVVSMALLCFSPVSGGPLNIVINEEFSLGIGQIASIEEDKLFIKFKAVLEDSRCPDNVLCTMAGNGKVELEIIEVNKQNKTVILNTEDMPREAALGEYRLILISLHPHRIDGVKISPRDYFVNLRIESKTTD